MGKLDTAAVVRALTEVLGNERRPIALHEPSFRGHEWRNIKECLDTGWVSSLGSYVDRFERELGDYVGGYAVSAVNGTAALHLCLKLAGVEANDEVLLPALTFVATANAVMYCGAVPHFVDSAEHTLGMDAVRLNEHLQDTAQIRGDACWNRRTGRRIRALLPMHTFGHPVDLDALEQLASRFSLVLVEDAAESLGSYYKGRHTGTIGALGALSFNGNKVITTGGGGAVVTTDRALAKLAKHLTTTARVPHRWSFVHDQVGYNYRMPNINAALGCAQLEQLAAFLEKKRALAQRYARAFSGLEGARIFPEPTFARSNYWLNTLILDEGLCEQRDAILDVTNREGIQTRPVWTLMHKLPMYMQCPRMGLPVAENLERRVICLPSSPKLVH